MFITNIAWLGSGKIGVVKTINDFKEINYYIASRESFGRFGEDVDAQTVANWGNSLDPIVGELIVTRLGRPYNLDVGENNEKD